MATLIEHLPTNADRHTVKNWIKRLRSAINIALFTSADQLPTDAEQKALMVESLSKDFLISALGNLALNELYSWTAPDLPEDKSFKDLIALIEKEYSPEPNKIAEEFKFNQIVQESTETLGAFYSRIKIGAQYCDFGARYDQMIRNRFVCGIRDPKIRQDLLGAKDDSTANVIYELACKKQLNRESSTAIGSNPGVNFVQKAYGQGSNTGKTKHDPKSLPTCTRCTLRGHEAADCRVVCRTCQKTGHIAKNCNSGKKSGGNPWAKKVNQVELDTEQPEEQHTYMFSVSEKVADVGEHPVLGDVPGISSVAGDEGFYAFGFSIPEEACTTPACSCTHPVLPAVPEDPVSVQTPTLIQPTVCTTVPCLPSLPAGPNRTSVLVPEQNSELNYSAFTVFTSQSRNSKPFIDILLNGKYVSMELDTGAAVSCIGRKNFDRLSLPGCGMAKCNMNLCVANGHIVKALDKAIVDVKYNNSNHVLPLYVVDADFPTLLGLEWIRPLFGPDWFERLKDSPASALR